LEQPCQDCPWICKSIRVSEAGIFLWISSRLVKLSFWANKLWQSYEFSGTYMKLIHHPWSTRTSSHPTFYWIVSWTLTFLILGLQTLFPTRNSR
jgi:hypothetical protein